MNTRKRVSVSFQGDDEVVQHIISIKEKKTSAGASKPLRARQKRQSHVDEPQMQEEDQEKENNNNVMEEVFRKATSLVEEGGIAGADVYGFKTPKKSGQILKKASESAQCTPKTQKSTSGTPKSILKKKRGALQSESGSTPVGKRATRRKKQLAANTPHRLRARHKHGDSDGSSDDSGEDEEEESEDSRPSTPTIVDDTVKEFQVEDYFSAAADSNKTSDRTLARLGRMDPEQLADALSRVPAPAYTKQIKANIQSYTQSFDRWMYLMCCGYNLLLHGVGSKRSLIQQFMDSHLSLFSRVVINGYFPSLTMKSILNHITEDIMEHTGSFRNPVDQVDFIKKYYGEQADEELYLIVHNIDGPMLRSDRVQTVLSLLAQAPCIHILASIDHINAPLIWDSTKSSRFQWAWLDATTFAEYGAETSYENSLLVQQSGALALSSLTHVLRSLTPNARGIFALLVNYQMEHCDENNYSGISFPDLYQACRAAFLVPSDLALRSQLTEFHDHRLIRSRKGADGVDSLTIPLDSATLKEFLESQEGE